MENGSDITSMTKTWNEWDDYWKLYSTKTNVLKLFLFYSFLDLDRRGWKEFGKKEKKALNSESFPLLLFEKESK